jgi:DNA-binding winged helix-turn-helix (wHTH) protein
VRAIELLTDLPWNTASPDDNHLKQQIRRVRKALTRLGLDDVIEARHGFGYRLTVEPLLGA